MKTKYFSDSETIGFEVKSAKDIFAAKEIGMIICNEDDYAFDDMVTYTNEDGEEWEREPTEDEITNRAIEHLNNGGKVYATIYPSNYKLVDKRATTLQTDFFVGQKVYTMIGNKITEVTIMYISLSSGNLSSSDFNRALFSVAENLYYTIGFSFKNSLETYVPSDKEKVIKDSIKKYAMGNQIIASYLKNGSALYDTFPIGEVFATKEELVKHLMED